MQRTYGGKITNTLSLNSMYNVVSSTARQHKHTTRVIKANWGSVDSPCWPHLAIDSAAALEFWATIHLWFGQRKHAKTIALSHYENKWELYDIIWQENTIFFPTRGERNRPFACSLVQYRMGKNTWTHTPSTQYNTNSLTRPHPWKNFPRKIRSCLWGKLQMSGGVNATRTLQLEFQ